jgi:hypothetical protein
MDCAAAGGAGRRNYRPINGLLAVELKIGAAG